MTDHSVFVVFPVAEQCFEVVEVHHGLSAQEAMRICPQLGEVIQRIVTHTITNAQSPEHMRHIGVIAGSTEDWSKRLAQTPAEAKTKAEEIDRRARLRVVP